MKKRKNSTDAFKFQQFSTKQKKLLTWWTPNSPYRDFDMVIADGAVRSGKTVAELDSFMMWSLTTFEDEGFIIAAKSMGALKRNVLQPLFKILTAKGIPYLYNRSAEDPHIQIGTNRYYLFGANNEKSQDTLQGMTAAGAYADEIALFPQSFVEQMIARCSVDGAKVFANCNPQGPYHWFKLNFIDKAKEKRILYLHFTMDDNLSLSDKIKAKYRRMFNGIFFKRYILGLWVLAEGIVYDMFDEEIHAIDCPQEGYDEYGVAVDYGTATVMTFGLYGIRKSKVFLLREYYYDAKKTGKQKTDGEFADEFVTFVEGYSLRNIYIDPSAASFKAELRNRKINNIKDADNDVINGIRLVSNFLRDGRFFVDRSCRDDIREFSAYIWDEKAQQRGEDKPLKQNDHSKDRDRYFIYTRFGNVVQVSGRVVGTTASSKIKEW